MIPIPVPVASGWSAKTLFPFVGHSVFAISKTPVALGPGGPSARRSLAMTDLKMNDKIEALQRVIADRAATPGEKANAKRLIKVLKKKRAQVHPLTKGVLELLEIAEMKKTLKQVKRATAIYGAQKELQEAIDILNEISRSRRAGRLVL
jgi:hypothetical protein